MDLEQKIKTGKAGICIVGLGYVGLPLLIAYAKAGFSVAGIDIDLDKINRLKNGISYLSDIPAKDIEDLNKEARVIYSSDYSISRNYDAVIVCVPTPLDEKREPDLGPLRSAVRGIAHFLKSGAILIIESTVYPGAIEEVVIPILTEEGKEAGVDYRIAYSPERIDPGNKLFGIRNTPKLIGGQDPDSTRLGMLLYGHIVEEMIPVSGIRTAEMTKIVENAFRNVNIAFVNELAKICRKLSIDVWEVLDAASTKPFGYMRFYPGPGIGGHCIPIDPVYLTWKLNKQNISFRMVEEAAAINAGMPDFVVDIIASELSKRGKSLTGSNILVLGAAYKKDVNDCRESPSLIMMEKLRKAEANVCYYDPYIETISIGGKVYDSIEPTDSALAAADCVLLATDHTCFDYDRIAALSKLIMDTRRAFYKYKSDNIVIL